jgi:hypothetical protein
MLKLHLDLTKHNVVHCTKSVINNAMLVPPPTELVAVVEAIGTNNELVGNVVFITIKWTRTCSIPTVAVVIVLMLA